LSEVDTSGAIQPDNHDREQHNREFVRLLAQHELRLAGYVHSLIPQWSDAEDVLQETKLRLWDQFDQFRPGADFAAWAFTIATYMVRAYRKKSHRQRLCFNEDVLQRITDRVPEASLMDSGRVAALINCVRTLSERCRRLLQLFYVDHQSVKDIAWDLDRSPTATYQALSRIRRSLRGCVEKRLEQEARR